MPIRRNGFNDSLVDARLTWLTGTAYPASPAGLYIALLAGVPFSDGSGVTNELVRVGPVTYTAPASPSGDPGWPHLRGIQPSAAVSFTIPGTPAPGFHANGLGWALYGQSSGGAPLYAHAYSWSLLVGVPTTLPAATFMITATEQT